jgi:hypothetical protein
VWLKKVQAVILVRSLLKAVTVPMARLELAEVVATTAGASNPRPRRKIRTRQVRQAAYNHVMIDHSSVPILGQRTAPSARLTRARV